MLSCPLVTLKKLETALKEEVLQAQKWLEVTLEQEKQMKMFKSCLTVQEIFNQHKSSHQGLVYKRIPLADCSAPSEEVINTQNLGPFVAFCNEKRKTA